MISCSGLEERRAVSDMDDIFIGLESSCLMEESKYESLPFEMTLDDLGCHRSPVISVTLNSAIYLLVFHIHHKATMVDMVFRSIAKGTYITTMIDDSTFATMIHSMPNLISMYG